jgi:DNA-binding MurR/RpiR family transcriptional regulator
MNHAAITDRIAAELGRLPASLQAAGRYVLENPRDVALLSMREQARRAGLQPATMTRFAKRIGLKGYDSVRSAHAERIRNGGLGFAGKAGAQVKNQKHKGERALAAEMAGAFARQIAQLAEPEMLDQIAAAAEQLHAARRIFCRGLRSCHAIAWHLHYICSLFTERTTLLDQVAGVGTDAIRNATSRDVLLVASVKPYTRATVDVARYAAGRGVAVIALTDSKASPLVAHAGHALFITTGSPSFFHTMTPAFALCEILATLAAGRDGVKIAQALKRTEAQLAAFNVHWCPGPAA